MMTSRQCEIAAESYAACLLAQSGYDVFVQYGANQPHFDLLANKERRFLPISVKGSQDGGWMLAVRYIRGGLDYHKAIDAWFAAQRDYVIFMFVQFMHVPVGTSPRVYIAKPSAIAAHLKTQFDGRGNGALQEDYKRDHPNSRYDHKIPQEWAFSRERMDGIR